jgi:hypothetical protein
MQKVNVTKYRKHTKNSLTEHLLRSTAQNFCTCSTVDVSYTILLHKTFFIARVKQSHRDAMIKCFAFVNNKWPF